MSRPAEAGAGVDHSVAVVVVTYNSAEVISGLLESLPEAMSPAAAGPGAPAGFHWQLVIADNASADGTLDVVSALAPAAIVVEMGRNAGYAAGINAAVGAAAPHTAVLVLNPDVRLDVGCVDELLRVLHEPGVGIAVPALRDGRGAPILSMRREPTVRRMLGDALLGAERAGRFPVVGEIVSDPRRYRAETDTDWAEGSTQLISSACWTACAGWDERFFLYSEEADFDLRAGDLGFATRYVPSARATHLKGDSATSPGLWSLLTVNRVKLYHRRHRLPPTLVFWAAILLRESTRALQGRATSRAAVRALLNPGRLHGQPGPSWVL